MGEEARAVPLVGGRYELETLLGKGGVGEVWRARHVTLETHVAIKFLHGPSADSDVSRKRFVTEARVAAQLKTPYAVKVFDCGVTDEGRPYLVMDLLEGETLGQRLKRVKRLSPEATVRFLGQAAQALERAHSRGIVHRDFKPDNLLILRDEETKMESVKVLDFGVAKLVRELAPPPPADPSRAAVEMIDAAGLAVFTCAGSLLGTPRYMAPEQVLNAPDLDQRADIWAFGIVAFECLTGRLPFVGEGLVKLFANIECGIHPLATSLRPDLPAAFDAWFEIACATDPVRRFRWAPLAAAELEAALRESSCLPSTSDVEEQRAIATEHTATLVSATAAGPVKTRGSLAPTASTGDDAFHAPPWDAPLDVRACLDAIPPDATMKGLFLIPMVTAARRRGIVLEGTRERYLPFSDYPLVEHARALAHFARVLFPNISLRQGLRKLGRQAYPSFLDTLIGKVLWASVEDIGEGLATVAKAYAISSPCTCVTIVEHTPRRARVRLDGVYYFLDSNHVGVFEGVMYACKVRATVLVRIDSPTSGELLLTWEPR